MVYLWASILLAANFAAWLSTLFGIPGNWLIVLFGAGYAYFLPPELHPRLTWGAVGAVLALALVGELLEALASAAGAKKLGGSRRGMLMSIAGGAVGSIVGAVIGVPVPVIGSLIAALGGAVVGAFIGAYWGEQWAGRTHEDRVQIGKAAAVGRLAGTLAKMATGFVQVVVLAIDAYVDFSR